MLGFTTHKTKTSKFQFTTKREKDTLTKLMDMYEKSLEDKSYRYERNSRFKNQKNDVKIVATQSISCGKVIYTLCGMTAPIKPEEIKIGDNDFSILTSSRSKKDLLFLSPAAYINHCCFNNTEWVVGRGEGVWCAKAIQDIHIGTEITTDYGDHYFGENQKHCECGCHPEEVPVNDESMGKQDQLEDQTSVATSVKSPVTQVESMGKQDQQEDQTSVAITSVKSYHHLVHYPFIMEKIGPLVYIWSMRFESKHRESKISAQSITCRKNICYSLSLKHQLKLAYQLISNNILSQPFDFGRKILLSKFTNDKITNILNDNCLSHNLNHVKFKTWVNAYGTRFVKDITLIFDEETIPNFVTIKYIFLTDDSTPFLLCDKLSTLEFDEHLQAFEVIKFNSITCFPVKKDLTSCIYHKAKNGTSYVTFR